MRQRPPLLAAALCLAVAAFGASACGSSDDREASASATPATPSVTTSAAPAEARGLTGLSAELYLKTIREHYPDLDRIADDVLVAHGDALCLADGQDLVDQVKQTKQELELTGKQASRVLGTAHGYCGRENVFE
jgi:hypothetical protein